MNATRSFFCSGSTSAPQDESRFQGLIHGPCGCQETNQACCRAASSTPGYVMAEAVWAWAVLDRRPSSCRAEDDSSGTGYAVAPALAPPAPCSPDWSMTPE